MKIAITGANGYIGARLSQYLGEQGHDVIAICYPSIPVVNNWGKSFYKILAGDVRNQETVVQIAELNADTIIHLISLDHNESEKELQYVSQINVLPTWNLLRECSKRGLKKFIYFSTIHVYGNLHNDRLIDENHSIKARNTYGLTHYLCENICDHYNRISETDVISVRISNSYGAPVFFENNCWSLVINDLCKSAYLNKYIKLLSDGSPQRDFIHSHDLCKAIELLIKPDHHFNENVYHICSGSTSSILELAGKVSTIYQNRYGKTIPVSTSNLAEVVDFEIYNNQPKYVIDNSRLKNLGFQTSWSLDKGINELFEYLEKTYGL